MSTRFRSPDNPPPPGEILAATAHRPWVLPERPWIMLQTLRHTLYAHWALPAEQLRPLLPSGLTLDLYHGQAWLSLVPFRVARTRLHGLPPIPGLSAFDELNARTYVVKDGKPGVWFFSLDVTNRLVVEGARIGFRSPFFHADIQLTRREDGILIVSRRTDPRLTSGVFEARYRPANASVFIAQPGTLDHWLTERYCLYTVSRGRLFRGNIHHLPWRLQPAEAAIVTNSVTRAHGIPLSGAPSLLHYSERQDMLAWALERA